jgi:DNA-binding NarL/FixJ family response regulator
VVSGDQNLYVAMSISIGIIDDHKLVLRSLSILLNGLGKYDVVVEAQNGKELQHKISFLPVLPDIILLDVNMPVMSGSDTAAWLQLYYPSIRLIALSGRADDRSILQMRKAGCCAYMFKDAEPDELMKAIHEVYTRGYYNKDASNINYRRLMVTSQEDEKLNVTEIEKEFLRHACSDLTYKEIAARMKVSTRSIEGWRDSLFVKLNVQSRVGLCLEALRRNYARL